MGTTDNSASRHEVKVAMWSVKAAIPEVGHTVR